MSDFATQVQALSTAANEPIGKGALESGPSFTDLVHPWVIFEIVAIVIGTIFLKVALIKPTGLLSELLLNDARAVASGDLRPEPHAWFQNEYGDLQSSIGRMIGSFRTTVMRIETASIELKAVGRRDGPHLRRGRQRDRRSRTGDQRDQRRGRAPGRPGDASPHTLSPRSKVRSATPPSTPARPSARAPTPRSFPKRDSSAQPRSRRRCRQSARVRSAPPRSCVRWARSPQTSTRSSRRSRRSPPRRTCSRSTHRSRPPAPATRVAASPTSPKKSACSPRTPRLQPSRSPSLVREIKLQTEQAVLAMEEGVVRVEDGFETVNRNRQTFYDISGAVRALHESSNDINELCRGHRTWHAAGAQADRTGRERRRSSQAHRPNRSALRPSRPLRPPKKFRPRRRGSRTPRQHYLNCQRDSRSQSVNPKPPSDGKVSYRTHGMAGNWPTKSVIGPPADAAQRTGKWLSTRI